MAAPDFPASPTVGQIYTAPSGILARFRPNRITRDLLALLERFRGYLIPYPDGCWGWRAYKDHDGYGTFRVSGIGKIKAHRLAWELVHGPIPQGLEPDHLCRNPSCPNPLHLELVTPRENALRGMSPMAQH